MRKNVVVHGGGHGQGPGSATGATARGVGPERCPMAESIRFAVVRWNRTTHHARAVVVEETRTIDGYGLETLTVRQSAGRLWSITSRWRIAGVRSFAARELALSPDVVAVVEVDHVL
jgi:hypothetical protein